MKTSDVLRKAAHVVLERGLAKRTYCDRRNRVCAFGALREADEDTAMAIQYYGRHEMIGAMAFNDRRSTTAEDVASLLMSEAEVVDE